MSLRVGVNSGLENHPLARRMDTPVATLEQTQGFLTQMALQFGPRVLSAALVLAAGWFTMNWVGRIASRGLQRFALEPPVRELLVRIVRVLVFGVFLLMALQNLGIELLPLVAGLGIAGAGIALALQGVLGNVVAGLTIIFSKPFRVGQYVSIAGVEGEVRSVTMFNTTLTHADLSSVVIPNRKIAGEILHNYGELRQLGLKVVITYDSDLELALATIHALLASNAHVLKDPAPAVQADALGDFGVIISIRPWVAVQDYGSLPGEVNPAILKAFQQHGIEIAAPPSKPKLQAVKAG
jgi:small conductance mechanosensitive channel